ncbi:MAG: glycosyl transferase [Peptococcaceae bacterium]|nr:glycosyl transferase [Peptococcaceae bacterium]
MKNNMKEILKKTVKKIIQKSSRCRKIIYRLYNASFPDNSSPDPVSLSPKNKKMGVLVSDKVTYSGHSIDYLNSKFLTKEERSRELKRIFYNNCKYYLDLDNPKTFNQKLQWLKLNYYDSKEARCVDKAEFKQYVKEVLGDGYTVPLYGVWDDENQIDFSALPQKFVLKSTVQSDGRHIVVVEDKEQLDIDNLKTIMSSWLLPRNTLCSSYCSAYKNVKPRILAEEYIDALDGGALLDYKFMCFNGKVEMLFIVADRDKQMCVNFYDLDWNLLPFTRKYPNTSYEIKKPKNFDLMVELAQKLCEPFPFVRVDFYESSDQKKVYVGELTFYPGGGYETFEPLEWDYKLGDLITLPTANI